MESINYRNKGPIKQPKAKRVKILSVGTYLPDEVVLSDDLFSEIKSYEQYNIPTNWLSEKVGIIERRAGASNAVPSDHALPAAEEALANLPESITQGINLVIFCGIEVDQNEPATAHRIQDKLGINASHAFDLSNACFGFVEAIQIASTFIELGTSPYALVVTGEISTQVMRKAVENLKKGMPLREARNIIGALTVGDAGGAVVVGKSEADEFSGFDVINRYTDSNHIDKCIYRRDENGAVKGQMLMGQISNQIIRKHETLMSSTMEALEWDKIDWVLSHQMGKPPFEKIQNLAQVDDNSMIKTFPHLGNITTVTFPVNFKMLSENGTVRGGDKVFGFFAGSGLAIGQFGYSF